MDKNKDFTQLIDDVKALPAEDQAKVSYFVQGFVAANAGRKADKANDKTTAV